MSKKLSLDYSDIRRLAAHLCDIEHIDYTDEILERIMVENFDADMESFASLVEYLVPLMCARHSTREQITYMGFARDGNWYIRAPSHNSLIDIYHYPKKEYAKTSNEHRYYSTIS